MTPIDVCGFLYVLLCLYRLLTIDRRSLLVVSVYQLLQSFVFSHIGKLSRISSLAFK